MKMKNPICIETKVVVESKRVERFVLVDSYYEFDENDTIRDATEEDFLKAGFVTKPMNSSLEEFEELRIALSKEGVRLEALVVTLQNELFDARAQNLILKTENQMLKSRLDVERGR